MILFGKCHNKSTILFPTSLLNNISNLGPIPEIDEILEKIGVNSCGRIIKYNNHLFWTYMKTNTKYLKKQIIYKWSHSGTKETDILYNKLIVNKINSFSLKELYLILELLSKNSDPENYLILTKKKNSEKKFKALINKINS